MSLRKEFQENIAFAFGVSPADVVLEASSIQLSPSLPQNPVCGSFDLASLLDSATLISKTEHLALVERNGRKLVLEKLQRHSGAPVEHGVIDWPDESTFVFTGSFGQTASTPSLDVCPELLLAIAIWEPDATLSHGFDWASLLQTWGPVACTFDAQQAPSDRLAFCGYGGRTKQTWNPAFAQLRGSPAFRAQATAINEAREAFRSALRVTHEPDLAFIRLYRIFEIEFAIAIRSQIAAAPLSELIGILRSNQNSSELDTLRKVFDRSNVSFAHFSRNDWDTLFGAAHVPGREQYGSLSKWVSDPARPNFPPDPCRAYLVYYVRNALVHAKMQKGDVSLLPPFSSAKQQSLGRLFEDCLAIVRSLLFV
jgi:hypothetical protein